MSTILSSLIVLCLISSPTAVSGGNDTIDVQKDGTTSFKWRFIDQPVIVHADFYNGTSDNGLSCHFDWGDGTISNWSNGHTRAHEYDRIGNFSVKIAIRDSNNYTCKKEINILIFEPFPKHYHNECEGFEFIILGLVGITSIIFFIVILLIYRRKRM